MFAGALLIALEAFLARREVRILFSNSDFANEFLGSSVSSPKTFNMEGLLRDVNSVASPPASASEWTDEFMKSPTSGGKAPVLKNKLLKRLDSSHLVTPHNSWASEYLNQVPFIGGKSGMPACTVVAAFILFFDVCLIVLDNCGQMGKWTDCMAA